jgi:hypothetical protein
MGQIDSEFFEKFANVLGYIKVYIISGFHWSEDVQAFDCPSFSPLVRLRHQPPSTEE